MDLNSYIFAILVINFRRQRYMFFRGKTEFFPLKIVKSFETDINNKKEDLCPLKL